MRLMISLFLLSYGLIGFSMDASTEKQENEAAFDTLPVEIKAEILLNTLDGTHRFRDLAVFATVDKSFHQAMNEAMHRMSLQLSSAALTDINVERIKHIGSLRLTFVGDKEFSDDEIRRFAQLTNLNSFSIASSPPSQLKGDQVQILSALDKISSLCFMSQKFIGDDDLKAFANFTRLIWVRFDLTAITSKGLKHLKNSKYLMTLEMSHTNLSNDDVKNIVEIFSYLSHLSISGKAVTDDAVPYLATLIFLSDVDISKTSITHVGIRQLKIALPDCAIRGVDETLTTKEELAELKKLFSHIY